MAMNADQVEGAVRKVGGKAQEAFGDLTGSARHEVEGLSRQAAGRAQEAYGDAKRMARDAGTQATRFIEEQPWTSLLVVGAIGFVLGMITARR
jgi:uncharacterized protein YjbJ (UPF0337 family)